MKKVINMGYCKTLGDSRRRKAVVTVELKHKSQGFALSIRGEIKGLAYGQCWKEMKEYAVEKRSNFDEIIEIWEKYHLNDMRVGTSNESGWLFEEIPETILNKIFSW